MSSISSVPTPKPSKSLSLLFSLEDKASSLSSALHVFQKHGISLEHIESRPSKSFQWEHEFLVEFATLPPPTIAVLVQDLGAVAKGVRLIGAEVPEVPSESSTQASFLGFTAIDSSCNPVVPETAGGFGHVC